MKNEGFYGPQYMVYNPLKMKVLGSLGLGLYHPLILTSFSQRRDIQVLQLFKSNDFAPAYTAKADLKKCIDTSTEVPAR